MNKNEYSSVPAIRGVLKNIFANVGIVANNIQIYICSIWFSDDFWSVYGIHPPVTDARYELSICSFISAILLDYILFFRVMVIFSKYDKYYKYEEKN